MTGQAWRVAVTVDELTTLAEALGVSEALLLYDTGCAACGNSPPLGFACLRCGQEGQAS